MQIHCDRNAKKLWLSQEKYVEGLLARFNIKDAKVVNMPLASHFELSKRLCHTTDEEKEWITLVPYSSVVGSLMYAMVCTCPDIAYAVGLVSRFLSKPWERALGSSEVDL